MKKIILLFAAATVALTFNACKKDDDNKGGGGGDATKCKLTSIKELIKESGSPDAYGGFVMYYDGEKIIRANFRDSATGNEDSTTYAQMSYSGSNVTDIKFYQDGQLSLAVAVSYNSKNKIASRTYTIDVGGNAGTVKQSYFYDNDNKLDYSLQEVDVNIPPFGHIVSKDSAKYSNYGTHGRPGSIIVYNSTTSQQGAGPYEFSEELKYEYDANGNRTLEASKEDVADPFTDNLKSTFDLTKTPGDAEQTLRFITTLFPDGWEDPNLDTKDIDKNLKTTEIEFTGSSPVTTNTSYTMNTRNSPDKSEETSPTGSKSSTYTYLCK